jgi:hypothetical protein
VKWLSGCLNFNFLSGKWLVCFKELWTLLLEEESSVTLKNYGNVTFKRMKVLRQIVKSYRKEITEYREH